eukprot:m.51619 g.51619  ORF g.51619 m.51619 type:complete len:1134 (-) comp11716_c0_seq2:511-3912(-)
MLGVALVCLLAASVAAAGNASVPKRFATMPYDLPALSKEAADQHVTIHVIPHTHDDVGWLDTVDGYYLNQVQWILDTAIQCLLDNPERKFTYVELAYFYRWWQTQPETTKEAVRGLVKRGQLEFNLGGWCMNDEANPIYWQEIDQMTLGAQFLLREFGVTPTVGWHVDPFGHSSSTASMWQQMGMNAFGFWRIHYALAQRLAASKSMEFVWRSSDSLGTENDIWCHIMPYAYCTPGECGYDGGLIVDDDPLLPTYQMNIKQQAEDFVRMARDRLQFVRHSHVLIPFGCDFAHQNAYRSFKQMDKLIAYVNADPSLNATVQYSFFSDYAKAVHQEPVTWPLHKPSDGDFFPYADHPHAYWTGYYTSRPALKQFIRTRATIARNTEFLHTVLTKTDASYNATDVYERLDVMRQAIGVAQHHDAVSGTEKQHVSDDYHIQLQQGTDACNGVLPSLVAQLATKTTAPVLTLSSTVLNTLQAGSYLPVVLFNSLGWSRSDFVALLTNRTDLIVVDESGALLPSQINPVPHFNLDYSAATSQRLFFQTNVPALGIITVFVAVDAARARRGVPSAGISNISSMEYQLSFSASGRLSSISNVHAGITRGVAQDFFEYVSASQSEQNSGAYVFRPEQGNRLSVGSDNDGGHPYVSSTWNFIEPNPDTAKMTAFLTPVGDAQFTDTFGTNVRSTSPKQLNVTTGRVDGQQPTPDPWGQGVSTNFLPFDLNAPAPAGFQLESHAIGASPTSSYRLVTLTFAKPYSAVPRVLVTARGSVDCDDLFVVSVAQVTAKDVTVNVSLYNGVNWSQSLSIDTLSWSAQENEQTDFPSTFAQGFATATVSKDGPVARFTSFPITTPLGVADPIIIATVGSATHSIAATVVNPGSTSFDLNVACAHCTFKAGDKITVTWLAFARTWYGAAVTNGPVLGSTITGPYVSEVWQTFRAGYASQTLRLFSSPVDSSFIEAVHDVGPLDKGRELVTRFNTTINTATSSTTGEFFTDDNGLEMLQRFYNTISDEPIAGNYFPASQRAILRDLNQSAQLTAVMTSSHGCGSHRSGHIEFMLHRRCLKDDGYGVGEVLDEADQVEPSIWLVLNKPAASSATHRRLALLKEFPTLATFNGIDCAILERAHCPGFSSHARPS